MGGESEAVAGFGADAGGDGSVCGWVDDVANQLLDAEEQ